MKKKNIIAYMTTVSKHATEKVSCVIQNSGPDHARIVMSNIFRTAKEYVYIFAGDLNGAVSKDEYLTELEKFIKRPHTKLKVILERSPASTSKAFPLILKYSLRYPEKVSIAKAELAAIQAIQKEDGVHHFTIADDRMSRDEKPEKKREMYFATVNFNNVQKVFPLKKDFNTLEKGAKPFTAEDLTFFEVEEDPKKISSWAKFINLFGS